VNVEARVVGGVALRVVVVGELPALRAHYAVSLGFPPEGWTPSGLVVKRFRTPWD
jgi:hypothetical protein